MPRIPARDASDPDLPEDIRALLSEDPINVFRLMANHPDALRAFLSLAGATYWGGTLPPRLREIAWLGASAVNACHY
jgi:alkylhydroperoxidase family enzyme